MPITLPQLLSGGLMLYSIASNQQTNKSEYDIYRQRNMLGLSQDTQDIIKLITFSDSTEPVGSFKYKVHRYPGDIDIFEPVKICCTRETALNKIAGELQDMACKVKKSKTIFWGDFKAGLDMKFSADDRDNYIVRWTIDEIISGNKKISSRVLSLKEAITHQSLIKLDLWAPVNGNYTEVTNFFLFVWTDGKGNDAVLNAPLEDRVKSLNHDIDKYGSKEHWKPLKLAKRLWNKALYQKDRNMTQKLYPLFSSGAAIVNQVSGECETLAFMYRKLSNVELPHNKLNRQINGFMRRLNDVAEFEIKDIYYTVIEQIEGIKDNGKKADMLEQLQNDLEHEVSKYTGKWLKTHRVI